jgi:hypothetical protein
VVKVVLRRGLGDGEGHGDHHQSLFGVSWDNVKKMFKGMRTRAKGKRGSYTQ